MQELLIQVFLGFVAVPLSSLLKNVNWSPNAKLLLVMVVCTAFGFASMLFEMQVTVENALQAIAVAFTSATMFYRLYFERTSMNEALENTEIL